MEKSKRGNFLSTVFGGAVVLGLLTLAGAPPRAYAEDQCQKRTIHADRELHKAVEHHGWNSPQAAHWREVLQTSRQYCWQHSHRWWDEDGHRWRSEHDWDDHDHDHDHNH